MYKEYGIDQSLGVDPHVDVHTDYGSVTLAYRHESNGYFTALDGRYSQGDANYKSASGAFNNIPDKEGEVRLRTGADMVMWHGHLLPYIGVGSRMFYDKFKDIGPGGYDRHITQFYAPIGTSYRFTDGDWIFTPNIEFDFLIWGQVNSHLGTLGDPNLPNITNTQNHGIGGRSEFMVGRQFGDFTLEAGPFMRYWHVDESSVKPVLGSTPGTGFGEPKNARLQYGGALRVTY